jgi:hypothetical protein
MKSSVLVVAGLVVAMFACGARGQVSDGSNTQNAAELQLREKERQDLKNAASKSKLDELVGATKLASDLLDQLSKESDKFLPRVDDLMTNDEGRHLALDDSAFLSIIELQKNPIVSKEQIAAKKNTIDAIAGALNKAQSDTKVGMIPPASIAEEIADAKQWAKDTLVKVQSTESMLDAVATKEKAADTKDAPTLKVRIDAYRLGQIELLNRSRLAGENAAKPEAQQKMEATGREAELLRAQEESDRLLRETRAELERMRIENEMQIATLKNEQAEKEAALQKQLSQAQATRTIADAQNQVTVQKAQQDAEMTKKRQQCHDPAVTNLLSPFLANGYLQPKTGKGIDSVPMSLSEIRAVGALEPTKRGLGLLMQCANLKRANDRPGWGGFLGVDDHGGFNATDDQLEMTKKAQKTLNELGDALVAEGLLSK